MTWSFAADKAKRRCDKGELPDAMERPGSSKRLESMSHVTDILLCTAMEDGAQREDKHPNADQLSAWLVERHGPSSALKRLDQLAKGGKVMQADVFGVAVNGCNIEGLVEVFKAVPWEHPESAQLLLKDEAWDGFRLYGVGPAA